MACIARSADPLVLRGSLTTFRRRCGKPTCHCATGDRHESPALVYLVDGQSKTMTLRAEEVADVAAAVARYQARRAELEAAAEVGLRLLAERRRARR